MNGLKADGIYGPKTKGEARIVIGVTKRPFSFLRRDLILFMFFVRFTMGAKIMCHWESPSIGAP